VHRPPHLTRMNALRHAASQHLRALGARAYASGSGVPDRKVAVLGAGGGIGQPLSLLMKVRPYCSRSKRRIVMRQRLHCVDSGGAGALSCLNL